MPRKFKKKDTAFKGLLNAAGDGVVSSFQGRINGGAPRHLIGVDIGGEWLTIAQAKRLVRILQEHIQRVEGAQGASITSGSSKYKGKANSLAGSFIGYGEGKVAGFLMDVERLAKKHFLHWENDYIWKVVEGQKSELTVNFQAWQSALKAKAVRAKARK